jgi:hypothetical protein
MHIACIFLHLLCTCLHIWCIYLHVLLLLLLFLQIRVNCIFITVILHMPASLLSFSAHYLPLPGLACQALFRLWLAVRHSNGVPLSIHPTQNPPTSLRHIPSVKNFYAPQSNYMMLPTATLFPTQAPPSHYGFVLLRMTLLHARDRKVAEIKVHKQINTLQFVN